MTSYIQDYLDKTYQNSKLGENVMSTLTRIETLREHMVSAEFPFFLAWDLKTRKLHFYITPFQAQFFKWKME